jgi:hypothetical protein
VRNTYYRKDADGVNYLSRRAFCGVCRELELPLGAEELRSLLRKYDAACTEKVLVQ